MAHGLYAPIVQELVNKIGDEHWGDAFQTAVTNANMQAPYDMQGIETLGDYYTFVDGMLKWVPFESSDGREIYRKLCIFYFIFAQPSLRELQTEIKPENANKDLKCLSKWLVRYAEELGKFMDTPESFTEQSRQTFIDSPSYNMGDYIEPQGGWKSFNQFFARNTKPGYRPIASIEDDRVIVSPADSTYEGQWPVEYDSNTAIDVKGVEWKISELLYQSDFKDAFNGGIFMHSFLKPNDYHRLHAPVGGIVREAKVIQGQVYLEVVVGEEGGLEPIRRIHPRAKKIPASPGDPEIEATDTTGYQFCQMRGLFVLETQIGLVAVLPIGMAQVSSVVLTAEKDKVLRKGEELGYFQFGGSDIVLVFQKSSNVTITATPPTNTEETHYNMGMEIGTANPLPSRSR
ncbi:putative phosphatidylserine decarboxylase [Nemania sp. FL0031]|nr:putative phosphatidylserine decarboxylase [Nemania sp. FL0031]